ncbi:hypothetical protein MJT46_004023 [Ovis ammon polii x Ovis aries]|nr:hypothetical protein MJT46_004023 [Ovis ammon polii x Ovis aries]
MCSEADSMYQKAALSKVMSPPLKLSYTGALGIDYQSIMEENSLPICLKCAKMLLLVIERAQSTRVNETEVGKSHLLFLISYEVEGPIIILFTKMLNARITVCSGFQAKDLTPSSVNEVDDTCLSDFPRTFPQGKSETAALLPVSLQSWNLPTCIASFSSADMIS